MKLLKIVSGEYAFTARLEEELAPQTCAAFMRMLPLSERVIHVRWSGEAFWIPYGDNHMKLPLENGTSHPSKGEALLYPGGLSEMEIIFAYGSCCFASKVGQLAGSHFLTVIEGLDRLEEFGKKILWEGAQTIGIALVE